MGTADFAKGEMATASTSLALVADRRQAALLAPVRADLDQDDSEAQSVAPGVSFAPERELVRLT